MEHFLIAMLGFVAMILSLSTHEFSHALVAYLQGDDTARRAGRLTLNPLAHVDPVGTVLIPLIGALTGIPVFGWAKPVPYNAYNLKYPKWGPTFVALAGPGSNFLGAAIYLTMLKFCVTALDLSTANLLVLFLTLLVWVNIALGIFNLIPVPPLDGSNIVSVFLDKPQYRDIKRFLETRGPFILLVIIMIDAFSPHSVLTAVFSSVINFAFSLAGLGGMI
jgi:Zn-dependent protease